MKNLENKEIKPGYLIKADGIGWGYVTKNKGILVVVLCVLEALCYPLDGLHILAVYDL